MSETLRPPRQRAVSEVIADVARSRLFQGTLALTAVSGMGGCTPKSISYGDVISISPGGRETLKTGDLKCYGPVKYDTGGDKLTSADKHNKDEKHYVCIDDRNGDTYKLTDDGKQTVFAPYLNGEMMKGPVHMYEPDKK